MGAFQKELNATTSGFTLITRSPEETKELGRHVGELAQPGDVYLLVGNLGAGKTCFTQGLARGLGIKECVLSPSFVIVREHHGRLPLYHIDLYRLDSLDEAADLGLDDYLYGQGVCVIEWADNARKVLPAENLRVEIDYAGDTERCFQMKPNGARYASLVGTLTRIYPAGEQKKDVHSN